MSLSRFCTLVACALLVGGLLGACQRAGEPEIDRTDDGVMRLGAVEVVDTVARAVAPSGRPLVLDGMRGTVHLTGTDRTTADLSFVRRGRGPDRASARSVAEAIAITESGTESTYTYTLTAEEDEDYAAVDVRGRVPRATALRIDRLSGAVRIDSVEGPLTIEHEHGSVAIQAAAAPVDVGIQNGDVQVDFRAVPAGDDSRLQTANGDMQVRVPPRASFEIDAQTDVGVIRTQGLSFTSERFAPVNAGARYVAQLGQGGPTIELRTQNGSITLRAVAPTDTADTTSAPATVPATDAAMAPQPDADTIDTMGTDTMSVDTTAADSVF